MYVCVCVCVCGCGCACRSVSEDPLFLQVDELTRNVNEISLRVEKIKHNQNVILASVQNQGELREKDSVTVRPSPPLNMEEEGQGDSVARVTSGGNAGGGA